MTLWRTLEDIRREYGDLTLSEENAQNHPMAQFKLWFEEVLKEETSDPTAMVLSTVDPDGLPDSRVVLLKGVEDDAYIFYTNYDSPKAQQLKHNPYAALTFYWPLMARQVRIRGRVKITSETQSDRYFASRPFTSQISALASPQSSEVANRQALEDAFNQLLAKHAQEPIIRPRNWGGYKVIPDEIEFWQGRDNRLHDRIHYFKQNGIWIHRRLAP